MAPKTSFLLLALAAMLIGPTLRAQTPGKSADAPETASPRYYIGVAVESIPPLFARQLKLEPDQGLNIQRVIPDSPAAEAKLQSGDILVAVNDARLKTQDQLNQNINPPLVDGKGQVKLVTLEYIRDGDHFRVTITPALRPDNLLASGPPAIINGTSAPKTYAGADGTTHQVGTGYLIDTRNSNAVLNKSISSLTLGGKAVILSQQSDATGHVTTTVIVGGKTTVVDPAHLDALPDDLRNLVKPLLAPVAPSAQDLQQLQEKLLAQDEQIKELTRKLNELLKSQPQK